MCFFWCLPVRLVPNWTTTGAISQAFEVLFNASARQSYDQSRRRRVWLTSQRGILSFLFSGCWMLWSTRVLKICMEFLSFKALWIWYSEVVFGSSAFCRCSFAKPVPKKRAEKERPKCPKPAASSALKKRAPDRCGEWSKGLIVLYCFADLLRFVGLLIDVAFEIFRSTCQPDSTRIILQHVSSSHRLQRLGANSGREFDGRPGFFKRGVALENFYMHALHTDSERYLKHS